MMVSEQRHILDTNLLVSAALLPLSFSRQVFDLVMKRGLLLQSLATLSEISEVLRRPKFDKYVLERERLDFLAALSREAQLIDVTVSIAACRDPKDDKFLELAISDHANYIITGDEDLLVMHPFCEVVIISPHVYCDENNKL